MAIEDLTLDEMFALEKEHPPLVGSRTSVSLEPHERAGSVSESLEKLSDRELRVLNMRGAGLDPQEIAAQMELDIRTIRNLMKGLKRKLQKRLETKPPQEAALSKAR
jgi:RNA polymerase sigma factor (sigma-70 family)